MSRLSHGNPAEVAGLVRRSDGTFVIGASVTGYAMTVALRQNGQLLGKYGSGGIASVPVPGRSR